MESLSKVLVTWAHHLETANFIKFDVFIIYSKFSYVFQLSLPNFSNYQAALGRLPGSHKIICCNILQHRGCSRNSVTFMASFHMISYVPSWKQTSDHSGRTSGHGHSASFSILQDGGDANVESCGLCFQQLPSLMLSGKNLFSSIQYQYPKKYTMPC